MFKLIMFLELCKISKLVMHLNSCSMDLGHDTVGNNSCWRVVFMSFRDRNIQLYESI